MLFENKEQAFEEVCKELNMAKRYRKSVKDNLSLVEGALEWRLLQGEISKIDLIDHFVPHLEEVQCLREVFTDDSTVSATPTDFDKDEDIRVAIRNIYNEIIDLSYEYLSTKGFNFETDRSTCHTPKNNIVYMRQALMAIKEVKFLRKKLKEQIPIIVSVKLNNN